MGDRARPVPRPGGVPLVTCARITAERIGARLLVVPSAHHYPHVDSPDEVNAALLEVLATPERTAN